MLNRISDSILDFPHRWAGAVFLFVLAYIALVAGKPAIDRWGRAPEQLADLQTAVELVPGQIADRVLAAVVPLVDKHAGLIRQDLFGQVAALRVEVLGPEGRFVALQSAVLARVDQGVSIIEATRRENVGPLLTAATGTLSEVGEAVATYRALPDRLGAELRPSWLALQPEITCRQIDGSGYGGCWHSRFTALMGEAARVGGVFTQKFPSLADSLTGMASDGRAWTDKYVMPHPMTTGQKFKAAGKIFIGLGGSYLRGGGL